MSIAKRVTFPLIVTPSTDTLINTLIQYFAQRGLLVTLIQVIIMIVFFAAPHNVYWYVGIYDVLR